MTPGQVEDRQGELVGAVVAGFAEVASAKARCAVQVEELRQWSHDTAEAEARRAGKECADDLDHRFAERSVTVELACALHLPERSAAALLVESQSLVHEHPATLTALGAGEVSYRHALTVLDATVGLDEESMAQMDVLLAERARTTTVSGLKRVARRERERRDSRPMLTRHRLAAQDRRVELQPCDDGMAWLHQLLPAVQATAIFYRLSDIAAAVQSPEDPRTLAQLRADASVDLMLDDDARAALAAATQSPVAQEPPSDAAAPAQAPAPGEGSPRRGEIAKVSESTNASRSTRTPTGTGSIGNLAGLSASGAHVAPGDAHPSIAGIADKVSLGDIKPQVAVTVPVMTLLGLSEEPGDLAGHGPIDADTARRLAAQAPSFLRILTHPETGTVLSVGRDRYAVPADLKSWLRIRDETCRFPGCARRAPRCDIDHITDWAHGGTTDHHNLIHLCRHHHRLKHTTRWTVSTVPPDHGSRRGPLTGTPDRASPPDGRAHTRQELTHEGGAAGPAPAKSPSADVVHWTSPSGRTYIDRATVEIARRDEAAEKARSPSAQQEAASQFPELPPF